MVCWWQFYDVIYLYAFWTHDIEAQQFTWEFAETHAHIRIWVSCFGCCRLSRELHGQSLWRSFASLVRDLAAATMRTHTLPSQLIELRLEGNKPKLVQRTDFSLGSTAPPLVLQIVHSRLTSKLSPLWRTMKCHCISITVLLAPWCYLTLGHVEI